MSHQTDEERDKATMDSHLDALLNTELDKIGDTRFFPENVARRVASVYNMPGKDNSTDHRVKVITIAYVRSRLDRMIQRSRNGLRLWISISGGQWQYAPATTARQVRVFRNNYQEQEQNLGARKDRLDQVLDAHAAAGLTDDDPIRAAYEAALSGEESVAEKAAA